MPVIPSNCDPILRAIINGTLKTYSIWEPDVRPDDNLVTPPTFTQQPQDIIPPNFDDLSPEEQKRMADRVRYGGIKMRSDLQSETVKLTKRTLDIP